MFCLFTLIAGYLNFKGSIFLSKLRSNFHNFFFAMDSICVPHFLKYFHEFGLYLLPVLLNLELTNQIAQFTHTHYVLRYKIDHSKDKKNSPCSLKQPAPGVVMNSCSVWLTLLHCFPSYAYPFLACENSACAGMHAPGFLWRRGRAEHSIILISYSVGRLELWFNIGALL